MQIPMIDTNDQLRQDWQWFEEALKIAVEHHFGQTRWDGSPYILHPLRVTYQCSKYKIEISSEISLPKLMAASILHDTVEDTDLSLEELSKYGFPSDIVDAVDALTKRPKEKYTTYLDRVKANPIARIVKINDLKDNVNILTDPDFSAPDKIQRNMNRLKKYWEAFKYLSQE